MTEVYWDGRTSVNWQDDNWNDGTNPLTGLDWTVGDLRPHFEGTHTNYCENFSADPSQIDPSAGFLVDAAYGTASGSTLNSLLEQVGAIGGVVDIANMTVTDGGMAWSVTSIALRGSASISFQNAIHTIGAIYAYSGTHSLLDMASSGTKNVYVMNVDAILVLDYASGVNWNVSVHYSIQDEVQPDVSDVRAGIAFGVPGHTKMGTLPVPSPPTGFPRLGHECNLYRNAGSYSEPSWVEITLVRDVTLSLEKTEADATTRNNNGWKAAIGALREGSVEFEMIWDVEDDGFQALLDSFLAGTAIELAVMDGPVDQIGSEGLRATMEVMKFTRGEPLEEAVTAAVTVKPTLAEHAPEWLKISS